MNLRQKATSGVKWSSLSMAVITALRFFTMAILARLLSPSDFGLMAMIMVLVGLAQSFSDMGLSAAIIQKQDLTSRQLSSIFWINMCTGAGLFAVLVLLRPVAVSYFKQADLSVYLVFAALMFLIAPFGQVSAVLLGKELKFMTLSKVEMGSTAVSSFSALALGLSGFGVLSLILSELLGRLFTAGVLFYLCKNTWQPQFHFNVKEIRDCLSFGIFQAGERVLNFLTSNIDYIIIGIFLGPAALGFYTLAYNVMLFPLMKINPILTKVAFPIFAKIQQDNEKMRRGYCKVISHITMLTFPMLAGMLVVAPDFIRLVYGPQWEPSIRVLQIFCIVGVFKSLGNPVGSVLLAKGRADIGFYWNVFTVIIMAPAVMLGVKWGITGVAFAIFLQETPGFFIIQHIVNRIMDLSFSQYFRAMQSPLICSGIMLGGIIPLSMMLHGTNRISAFGATVIAGTLLYLVSYYIKDKMFLVEVRSLLRGT
jgi:lipopolysaccharide exporter